MYNAGVDVHQRDSLGLLALTDQGIAARDRLVLSTCAEHGVRWLMLVLWAEMSSQLGLS